MSKIIFQKTKLESISKRQWEKALNAVEKDEAVGISHAEISGDSKYRTHVASISNRVGCHFHKVGDEDYLIASGKGLLHWEKLIKRK